MARRRRRYAYPISGKQMEVFKTQVMRQQGYQVPADDPDRVKFEVAKAVGVPLKDGDNGDLTTEAAGKIGGEIGGAMVRELVRIAQQALMQQRSTAR